MTGGFSTLLAHGHIGDLTLGRFLDDLGGGDIDDYFSLVPLIDDDLPGLFRIGVDFGHC